MDAIRTYYPGWRKLSIHESSPSDDIVSTRLAAECENYLATQYEIGKPMGAEVEAPHLPCKRYRLENLESQTFPDETFDLVITQDVFEHVFRPDLAISEISRTLRPGGAAIMTVPLVRTVNPSRRRADLQNGSVEHLVSPPQYHGSPVGDGDTLVTIDWGYDIVCYLQAHSGLSFLMVKQNDPDKGIIGVLNEVLVGFKRPVPAL